MIKRGMCAKCQHIFASDEEVDCPECDFKAKPAGVMQVTGVPSLEIFKRNYGKAKLSKG